MKEEKRKHILVFGYFGYVNNQLDGQTIKTRAVFDLLRRNCPEGKVTFADTQRFRRSPAAVSRFFADLCRCDSLVWLPAHNNLKYLFPLVWGASKLFRFDIIYPVVGGWLSQFIKPLKFHRKRLGKIKAILAENQLAKKELETAWGYKNISVFPNFREDAPAPVFRKPDGTLKLVFMARINRLKGLEEIVELCRAIAAKGLGSNITIDFYGPIHKPDREYFTNEVVAPFDFVEYHGELQPEHIQATLQNYDLLLLPTRYYTEGFPGSVLDAYRAGIPVLVSEWKHAHEFVDDGTEGFIVDFENPAPPMIEKVLELAADPGSLEPMKRAAYARSSRYSASAAWDILSKYL